MNYNQLAKVWESPGPVDVYDCRKRSWYIETATCSKDIVILLDNSGSMYGFRNYIAQLTVKSVLDTFSNNDFINIYNYSETVRELVPCFNVSPKMNSLKFNRLKYSHFRTPSYKPLPKTSTSSTKQYAI